MTLGFLESSSRVIQASVVRSPRVIQIPDISPFRLHLPKYARQKAAYGSNCDGSIFEDSQSPNNMIFHLQLDFFIDNLYFQSRSNLRMETLAEVWRHLVRGQLVGEDSESSKNAGGHFVKSTQGRIPTQDPGCHNLSDCERAEREAGVTRVTDQKIVVQDQTPVWCFLKWYFKILIYHRCLYFLDFLYKLSQGVQLIL